MPNVNRSLRVVGVVVTSSVLPLVLAGQEGAGRTDSTSCPPGALTDWEIMASGVLPYEAMEESQSGRVMGPGMLDYGLPLGMPDGGLMMEVMQFQPNRILALQRQLRLEAPQIDEIERLVADRWDVEENMRVEMRAAVRQLRDAVEATEPDTAVVRRYALKLASQRDALYAELAVNAAAGRMLLTERQREQLLDGPCGLHHLSSPEQSGRGR